MAVSGKSIIHYTRNFDNLKGIIATNGFRLKYCLETIEFDGKSHDATMASPMVCFCDLPLTHAKEHIDSYGGYGIGLTKAWARDNQLNPVLYLEYGSVMARSLKLVATRIGQKLDNPTEEVKRLDKAARFALIRILAFSKRHMGPLYRDGELKKDNYVFYDEREWRYVPTATALNKEHSIVVMGEEYDQDKDSLNEAIRTKILSFSHEDIAYILVDSQADILPTIKCLQDKYENELPLPKFRSYAQGL